MLLVTGLGGFRWSALMLHLGLFMGANFESVRGNIDSGSILVTVVCRVVSHQDTVPRLGAGSADDDRR